MARTLGAAAGEVGTALGTEPIFIVEVTWGLSGPMETYADKDFDGLPGKILTLAGLDTVQKVNARGSTGSLSMTLDDTDGSIKNILNAQDVHKGAVSVYQTYQALTASDKFLLFSGEISTPIEWSEGQREIKFDVVVKIEDREVGFSPEQGEFDFISEDAVGKAWPLCFGSVVRVPAVKITDAVRGKSLTRYSVLTVSELDQLCDLAAVVSDAENDKNIGDTQLNPITSDENYAILIEALTSSTISLNLFKENLIFANPVQETNLDDFIQVCKDIQTNTRNLLLFAAQAVAAQNIIVNLELTILNLQIQIGLEQAKNPQDIPLISSLQATLAQANSDLTDAENDKNDAELQVLSASAAIAILNTSKSALTLLLTQIDLATIIIDDGDKFPQGTPLTIVINSLKFVGTFAGNTFTITESNVPFYTNVELAIRENDNANEFWIDDVSLILKNQYCWFSTGAGNKLVLVDNQEGARCFFSPLLYKRTGVIEFGFEDRDIYDPILLSPSIGVITETGVVLRNWADVLDAQAAVPDLFNPTYASGRSNIQDNDYTIEIGDDVFLDGDYQDTYIANLIPSTEVKEVMAFRTINGVRELLPIPSRYYDVDLAESIAGQTSTTLRFRRPLSGYDGEEWEEDVFVTLVSSEGPNTADIISYLLTTYSDLSIDAASFASVAAAIDKFPSHFAILDRPDALDVVEDIAWQARCAVFTKQTTAFIKYLAAEETEVLTLTEADVENDTFILTMTETEDLVTKFVAEWTDDYSKELPNKVVLRNNIPKYGKIERTFDFFIYNIEELVIKSSTFWMIRYSNTWKIIKFNSFLTTLELEVFDTVLLSFGNDLIATSDVKGSILDSTYDSVSNQVDYRIFTSVRSGEMDTYPLTWPATAAIDVEYPTENDPFAGGASG